MTSLIAFASHHDAAPLAAPGWAGDVLDELMARVGVDGLVAALRSPALMATVELHAAGIRATLADLGLELAPESLAGYAQRVLVAALACGRVLPADPGAVDWVRADWHLLRLVAVCALAEEHGFL